MGVNGAGKSTLLRCLNRVLTPSGGAVLMDGEDLSFMSRKKIAQKVGYVPQRRQDSSSSVFETVLNGAKASYYDGPFQMMTTHWLKGSSESWGWRTWP